MDSSLHPDQAENILQVYGHFRELGPVVCIEPLGRERIAPGTFGAKVYAAADAGEISVEEARKLVRIFIAAGTDTTIAALSHTLFNLASNPLQLAMTRDRVVNLRAPFDESLRYDSPIAAFDDAQGRISSDTEWRSKI